MHIAERVQGPGIPTHAGQIRTLTDHAPECTVVQELGTQRQDSTGPVDETADISSDNRLGRVMNTGNLRRPTIGAAALLAVPALLTATAPERSTATLCTRCGRRVPTASP